MISLPEALSRLRHTDGFISMGCGSPSLRNRSPIPLLPWPNLPDRSSASSGRSGTTPTPCGGPRHARSSHPRHAAAEMGRSRRDAPVNGTNGRPVRKIPGGRTRIGLKCLILPKLRRDEIVILWRWKIRSLPPTAMSSERTHSFREKKFLPPPPRGIAGVSTRTRPSLTITPSSSSTSCASAIRRCLAAPGFHGSSAADPAPRASPDPLPRSR